MSILKDKQGLQLELRKALKGINIEGPISIPMSAEADLDGAADLAAVIAKVNALLAKLRTAGLLGE